MSDSVPMPSDFENFVMGGISPATEFLPTASYDPDGDCIEFLATNASFYAKRIDSQVTVYYDQGTDEVVGGLIKGVSKMVSRQSDGTAAEIESLREAKAELLAGIKLSRKLSVRSHADAETRNRIEAVIRKHDDVCEGNEP